MTTLFIDYVALLLVNMAAGFVLLGLFVYKGLNSSEPWRWAGGFAVTGAVAFLLGLHMVTTWPITGSFNAAYGETSVLLGVLWLGTALALAKDWSLYPLAVYGVFAGGAAIVIGIQMIHLGMLGGKSAQVGIAFIVSGAAGVLATPTLRLRKCRAWRVIAGVVLLAIGIQWAVVAGRAESGHMERFQKWTPTIVEEIPPEAPPGS